MIKLGFGAAWVTWIALIFLGLTAARADGYDDILKVARQSIDSGNFQVGFELSIKAIQTDGGRFEAYYTASVALAKQGKADGALSYANKALAAASNDSKPVVQQLIAKINARNDADKVAKEANELLAGGQLFAAAEAFTKIYREDPSQAAAAGHAADARRQLQDFAGLADALRVVAGSDDVAAAQRARDELSALQPKLEELASANRNEGWELLAKANAKEDGALDRAEESFAESIRASPGQRDVDSPLVGMIVVEAFRQDRQKLAEALARAAMNGLVIVSTRFYDRHGEACAAGCDRDAMIAPMFCGGDIDGAVKPVFGPAGVEAVHEFCRKRREREAADAAAVQRRQEEARKSAELARLAAALAPQLARFSGVCYSSNEDMPDLPRAGARFCICVEALMWSQELGGFRGQFNVRVTDKDAAGIRYGSQWASVPVIMDADGTTLRATINAWPGDRTRIHMTVIPATGSATAEANGVAFEPVGVWTDRCAR